jgi:hopene-associated glycosyltransferase HpnB
MSYALAVAGGAALVAWVSVLVHPARPWDMRPRDDEMPPPPDPPTWPEVCVVVPARDEAGVLPLTLPALAAQDYPGEWHVVVVDDRSSDGTSDVANAQATGRVSVLEGSPLPDGWAGKVWALEQGAAGAGAADFLLLTDADILHAPTNLRELVAESSAQELALNSRMARLHVGGAVERLLVPPFAFFFALVYPMRRANDPRRRLAAAAGGCILLRRDALVAIGGLQAIRGAVIDDIALATAVKRRGLAIRLATSRDKVRSVRSYRTLSAFAHTVRRTAFTQLRYSWLLLAATVLALLLMFVLPPVLVLLWPICHPGWLAPVLGALAWAVAAVVYLPTLRLYGLTGLRAVTLPLAGLLYGAMTVDSALRHARGERRVW